MPKLPTTDLAELGPIEAKNQEKATKYLKASALLIGDIESLYAGITPLIKSPGGGIDAPDQLALSVTITCNQLMMSRMLFTKSVIAALRFYQGDAFTHLRRAIETCAFTVRMNKHRRLCKIWASAGFDDSKSYDAYRKEFQTEDVFPKKGHADFNPLLLSLKDEFDTASKLIHGSIFGSANHFSLVPKGANTRTKRHVNFFDLPPESLPSVYFVILSVHLELLELFGQVLQPHMTDFARWKTEHTNIKERVVRHIEQWKPTIKALSIARKAKATKTK